MEEKMYISKLIYMALALLLLVSCSISDDTKLAKYQVDTFHALLSSGKYNTIYSSASSDLQSATTMNDFIELLSAVGRKLGITKSSSNVSWNVNYHTSGTFVTLTQNTEFEHGDAEETFVYRIVDDRALLAGYHISSNALVIR
jgi:hypothetical protein